MINYHFSLPYEGESFRHSKTFLKFETRNFIVQTRFSANAPAAVKTYCTIMRGFDFFAKFLKEKFQESQHHWKKVAFSKSVSQNGEKL